MRSAAVQSRGDPCFEMPPLFVVAERRLAGQALDRWLAGGRGLVSGFTDNNLVIIDPFGAIIVESIGAPIAVAFGISVGMRLSGRSGLAAEICAACALIARDPQPIPFEASLVGPSNPTILTRGIALPIGTDPGKIPEKVQVVVNWREVLDRAATTRLRRELGAALRLVPSKPTNPDPFSAKTVI